MSALDKIAGYEKEKCELAALIEIFNNRKKYEAKGAHLPKGIVFYGEAGTGKTLFAEVLAKECALKQVRISLADSVTDTAVCRHIRKAFTKASYGKSPTMIFFDELDKLLPNEAEEYYSDRAKSILAQLLTLIDGMEASGNIVFVATCNNYADLPASMTRPGRFDKKIALGLPDHLSRAAIVTLYQEASPAHFSLSSEEIAALTRGFSCAALRTLINECILHSDAANWVSEELIRRKIAEIREEGIPTERSEASYTIDATRNVGFFLASRSYSKGGYLLTAEDDTICNAFLDALITRTDRDDDDDDDEYESYEDTEEEGGTYAPDMPYSQNDYLAAITALLGGYAAEEILLNKVYDNLQEALEKVDSLLMRMAECGFLGLPLLNMRWRDGETSYPDSHYERLHAAFLKTVDTCYQRARELITHNRPLAERLVAELLHRRSIGREDCEAILAEHGGIAV